MEIKKLIIGFITIFAITLVVSLVVTFFWSLTVHGISKFDWETSFLLALIIGISIPIIESRKKTTSEK